MKKTHKIISYLLLMVLPVSRVVSQVVMCEYALLIKLFRNIINNELYIVLIYLAILVFGLLFSIKRKRAVILFMVIVLISFGIYYFLDLTFDGIIYIAAPCGPKNLTIPGVTL